MPKGPFLPEPPRCGLDTAQWASPSSVRPLFRLDVAAEDFPFRDDVASFRRGEPLLATMARSGRRW